MSEAPDSTHGPGGAEDGRSSWQRELERLDILDGARVRLWRDEFLHLCVAVDGETRHRDVTPCRLFPVSERANYISFLDSERKEVALLRDQDRLDPESLAVLRSELTRTYFRPRILSVRTIEDSHGVARWEVETDRGARVFEVRETMRTLEETIPDARKFLVLTRAHDQINWWLNLTERPETMMLGSALSQPAAPEEEKK